MFPQSLAVVIGPAGLSQAMGYIIHSIGPGQLNVKACQYTLPVCTYMTLYFLADQFNLGKFFYGRIFDLVSGRSINYACAFK